MKCWDCGQELDTTSVEESAASVERFRIAHAVEQGAAILKAQGDPAHRALEALAQELYR